MERRFEPVDLMVAIGVFATIIGAFAFFMAANGSLSGTIQETINSPLSAVATAMQWVQPALGESIVEKTVLQRNAEADTEEAVFQLIGAMRVGDQVQVAGDDYLEQILNLADTAEEAQAGHVQYVMGRMIANFTARGVRNDHLSASAPGGAYNRHWIEITQTAAKRMDAEFEKHREFNLGEAIVTASLAHGLWQGQNQERLGAAMARMTQVQQVYSEASRAADVQATAVMLAAFRTEALDGRLTELAKAEPTAQTLLPYVQARTIPDIPVSILVAGSATAIAIFLVGLMWRSRKEELSIAETTDESSRTYRKAG